MRRWIIVLAAIGMATSACGGSTSSAATTPTASTAAIADVVTDPGMPEVLLLTTPSGAPEAIDSVCVEVSSEPTVLDETVARSLSRALELLGIDQVDSDCPAVLRIVASGGRTAANYQVKGECWMGLHYRITTELRVDSAILGEWTDADRKAPPDSIASNSVCIREDATVVKSGSFLGPVFHEMWGELGLVAMMAGTGGGRLPRDLELSDEVLQLIAHHLLTEPTDGTPNGRPLWQVLRTWTQNTSSEQNTLLRPLAPYLIALMDRVRSESRDAKDSIGTTLGVITGWTRQGYYEWREWLTLDATCLEAGGHLKGITQSGEAVCTHEEGS